MHVDRPLHATKKIHEVGIFNELGLYTFEVHYQESRDSILQHHLRLSEHVEGENKEESMDIRIVAGKAVRMAVEAETESRLENASVTNSRKCTAAQVGDQYHALLCPLYTCFYDQTHMLYHIICYSRLSYTAVLHLTYEPLNNL